MRYTLQHTNAGDYIVRNPMGREMSRHATEAAAQEWADARSAQDAAEWAAHEQAAAAQDAWDRRDAGLFQAQLTWQRWRSWLYAEIKATDRHLSGLRRASIHWPAGESADRQYEYMRETQVALDAANTLYDEAVSLDTRIKLARRERNATALTAALDEAADMLPRIKAAFPRAALPKEPPPVSETSRPKPLSTIVEDGQRDYLEARAPEFGSVSGANREAIRRWMEAEPLPQRPQDGAELAALLLKK